MAFEKARPNAEVVAISVDSADVAERFRQQLGLSFRLLCDIDRAVISRWSLLNSAERGGIAFPALFVLDGQNRIVFRSLDRLMSRADPAPVVTFLETWRADGSHRQENEDVRLQVPTLWEAISAYPKKWFGKR